MASAQEVGRRIATVISPVANLVTAQGPEARYARYSKSPSMVMGDCPARRPPRRATCSGRQARLMKRSPRSSITMCASPPRKVS